MKVDLKDLKNTFIFNILAEKDTKRDGVFDEADLQLAFGKEVAEEFTKNIEDRIHEILPNLKALSKEKSIQWQQSFYQIWETAATKRNQLLAKKMKERLQPDLEDLKETGYILEDFFRTGDQKSTFDSKIKARPIMAKAALSVLTEDFGFNFGENAEAQMFRFSLSYYVNFRWMSDVFAWHIDSPRHLAPLDQSDYISVLKNEVSQSKIADDFEAEFGIQLLVKGDSFPNDDVIAVVSGALANIRSQRPSDFAKFQKEYLAIVIETGEDGRYNAMVDFEDRYLTLQIPSTFTATSESPEFNSPWRTREEIQIFKQQRYREALEGILLHEFGHIVGSFNPTSAHNYDKLTVIATTDDQMKVPEEYMDIVFPEINVDKYILETFAQDYRIFLQSRGKEVMRQNFEGKAVPAYEKRLEFFKNEYALEGKNK